MVNFIINWKKKSKFIFFLILTFFQNLICAPGSQLIFVQDEQSKANVQDKLNKFNLEIHKNTLDILQELQRYKTVTDYVQTDGFKSILKPIIQKQEIEKILDELKKIEEFIAMVRTIPTLLESGDSGDLLETKLNDLKSKMIKRKDLDPSFILTASVAEIITELKAMLKKIEDLGSSLNFTDESFQPIFLFVDEFANTVSQTKSEAEQLATKIQSLNFQNILDLISKIFDKFNEDKKRITFGQEIIEPLLSKIEQSSTIDLAHIFKAFESAIDFMISNNQIINNQALIIFNLFNKNNLETNLEFESIFEALLEKILSLDFDKNIFLTLTEKIGFISEKLNQSHLFIQRLFAKIDEINNQNYQLKEKLAARQLLNIRLKKELEQKNKDLLDLTEKLKTSEENLRRKISDSGVADSTLQASLAAEKSTVARLQADLEKLRQENARLQTQVAQMLDDDVVQKKAQEDAIKMISDLNQKGQAAMGQAMQIQGMLSQTAQQFQQKEAMYQSQMSGMQQQFQQQLMMMQQQMGYMSQALNESRQQGYSVNPQVMQMQQQMAIQFQQQQMQMEKQVADMKLAQMKSDQDKLKEDQIKAAQKSLEDRQDQMAKDQIKADALRDKMEQMRADQQKQKDDAERRATDNRITDQAKKQSDQPSGGGGGSTPIIITQGFGGLASNGGTSSYPQANQQPSRQDQFYPQALQSQAQVDVSSGTFWQDMRYRLQSLEQDHNSQTSKLASFKPRIKAIESAAKNLQSRRTA